MTTLPTKSTLLAPEIDYLLIDGSGSMGTKWDELIHAADAFLTDIKSARLNSQVMVQVFSDTPGALQRDTTIAQCPSFASQPLAMDWGSTALYDAINLAARSLRDLNPPKATLLIVTDGDDNKSIHTSLVQARAILDWCRAKGYQVIFMGCDFNNSAQARALGASDDTAIGVQKSLLTAAAKRLAVKRRGYSATGEEISFTDSERTQFGGYLNAPKS